MPPETPQAARAPLSQQEQAAAVRELFENMEPDTEGGESPDPGVQDPAPVEDLAGDGEALGDPNDEPLGESLEEEGEPDGSEDDAGEDEGTPDGEIQTVAQFAEAAGWSPEELYGLNVKLDTGEEIPLGQVKDRLQDYARQESELAAQREQLDQEREQLHQVAQQQVQGQQALSQEVVAAQQKVDAIQAQYNSVNWDELGESDPGRAALLQQQLATAYAGAKGELSNAQQQQEQQVQQFVRNSLVEHDQQFIKLVPEWKDQKVVEQEAPQIAAYLQQWFKPQELSRIYDYRARMLARKAWQWDQHQAKVKEAKGKVRKAPKPVLRPGGGTGRPSPRAAERELNAKMQRAKQTGNRSDQIDAIDALLSAQPRK